MNRKIAVIGLGYVGLPVAVAFAQKWPVIGFDINAKRIESLQQGVDHTGEVEADQLINSNLTFTSDPAKINQADFIIVSVPTPINHVNQPDLTPIISASKTVGQNMPIGSIVVYESTVYPGVTEEVCVPVLEKYSGLKCGEDFFVGYSPERINPGDKEHTFENITKIVSGQNEEILSIIADVYGSVVKAGIYRAPSIKVAEAAKVIENTQRDLNIALMNELSIIFDRLNIDTMEVIKAASTKWNFLRFYPGLVGGHCIGVDPYYLTYKAESVGYHPQVILAGRRINDSMGTFVATSVIKRMILNGINLQGAVVTVLGLTFKENVPDIRNSKVIDIIKELMDFGIRVQVHDTFAESDEVEVEYGVKLTEMNSLEPADAVILAVPHSDYLKAGWNGIKNLAKPRAVFADVKSCLNPAECPEGIDLWRM
ncbi:MAG: nucleotide sugar dehydrogenase [Cohnella sp.]|uniref:nucleotide sugar dehydrogenase n=1 Tax=Cohnella sp. TaxID=1883426 RepID=UPI000E36F379|nr:nucleotide sugar dehydrogenase [Cohnella sp.]REK66486.1 MAG: nucleotide sugar dehydrogenase [Cohnella sp.]